MKRIAAAALVLAAAVVAAADGYDPPEVRYENTPYNGRFTFVRMRFRPSDWGPGRYEWGLDLKWNHDYPRAEAHFTKILQELTTLDPNTGGGNILGFDDPELLKYPVAYLSEPGYWIPSEQEAAGLRNYLAKGGFLIVDDFMQNEWYNFETQIRRALPWAQIRRLDLSHPIFDSFFRISTLDMSYPTPGLQWLKAEFFGIFEDNDPAKRLVVVINYNNDIGDYMEWSGTAGWWPVNITNEAYKLAINYIVYGLTR